MRNDSHHPEDYVSLSPLISVHAPKASGRSVGRMLKEAYGETFLANYQDTPSALSQRVLDPHKYFARKETLPAGIRCIHGHFHPGKFDLTGDVVLFTLLRHPVDNILSIYFFWKTLERQGDALHDYFCDNRLTIVETARLPLLRWLFSRTYFEDFNMSRFDVIGCFTDRENALRRLSERIGAPLLNIVARENVTPDSLERKEALGDQALRIQLESILADDIRFYERYAR
jgi:hypothetical protein